MGVGDALEGTCCEGSPIPRTSWPQYILGRGACGQLNRGTKHNESAQRDTSWQPTRMGTGGHASAQVIAHMAVSMMGNLTCHSSGNHSSQ